LSRGDITIFVAAVFIAFLFSTCIAGIVSAAQDETIMGYVVKRGKGFVIESDDGDYIVKGKDVSRLVGKLVEVTGIITESSKGDVIEVKSIEDVQDTLPE
jgi:hypothetical protein